MRVIVGYSGKRPVWSDNVPSSAFLATVRGEIVQGDPGATERHRAQVAAEKRRKGQGS